MLVHFIDYLIKSSRSFHFHTQLDWLQEAVIHDYLGVEALERVAGLNYLLQCLFFLLRDVLMRNFLFLIDFVDYLLEDIAGFAGFDDVG